MYDFALYDLHMSPLGLHGVARMLEAAGWEVRLIDALATDDAESRARLGAPRRRPDGTGKFFRQRVPWPAPQRPVERAYGRYGILEESLRRRIETAGAPAAGESAGSGPGAGVRGFGPDLILVGTGMTYWYPGVAEAAAVAREVYPGVPVVAGGTYATLLPDHCRSATGAEVAASMDELDRLLARLALPGGLRDGAGAGQPAVCANGRGSAAVRLNEGCPYRCDYCASHCLSPGFTPGDPDAAFAEVRRLYEEEGVCTFAFYDDALLIGKRTVFHRFLERVIERWHRTASSGGGAVHRRGGGAVDPRGGPRFYLPNALHMRHLSFDTARLMRAAGVQEVRLGFESDAPAFHAAHDAGGGPGAKAGADLETAVAMLTAAGFPAERIGVYVLAGLPAQYREEAEQAVRRAGSVGVSVYVSEFSPVPGSPLWDRCVELCELPIASEPLYQNNSLMPMAWDGFTRKDLAAVKELAAGYRRAAQGKK